MKKGCSRFFTLVKIMIASTLLIQSHAWATECAFGARGEGGTSTIVNTNASNPVYFHEEYSTYNPDTFIPIGGPYDAQLSPELWSSCRPGNDGQQMQNITYNSVGTPLFTTALWPTNIPDIYYAVRIYSDTSSGSYFQYTNSVWSDLSAQSLVASHNWRAQIMLYQSVHFRGNINHATRITPQSAMRIGGMSIGDHNAGDNQPWWFEVTQDTFSIPIAASTCQAAMVNGGSNNVDFGEMMYSSVLKNGVWNLQQFNLQLRGCNNVVAINYKVSSPKTDGSTGMDVKMTNTLTTNAASGIGVFIEQSFPASPSEGPYINSGSYTYVPLPEVGTSANIDLPFNAWLRADGTPLKPGNFKAIATFTIDYI